MNSAKIPFIIQLFLLMAGPSLIAGCGGGGPPTYPVTGEVVYTDGTPLGCGGRLIFATPNEASPLTGKGYIDSDGKFTLTLFNRGQGFVEGSGLEAGEYLVAVQPNVPDDRGTMSVPEYFKAMEPIEERFKRLETSGLRFTVSAESEANHFRVVIRRPSRKR